MEKCRGLLIISKCWTIRQIRNKHLMREHTFKSSYNSTLRKPPSNVPEIPNLHVHWAKHNHIIMKECEFKRQLVNEFYIYPFLNVPDLNINEKINLLQTSIENLVAQNFVRDMEAIVRSLLSQLEPFPFELCEMKGNKKTLTVLHIRDIIEKYYLSWKLKTPLTEIEEVLTKYNYSLFQFRSLLNVQRSLEQLEELPNYSELSLPRKIYYINQNPFSLSSILRYEEFIGDFNWEKLLNSYPKIITHPIQHILLILSLLRELKFTENQIKEGLTSFYLTFGFFIRRLSFILSYPKLSKYRNEEKFLTFLNYSTKGLKNLSDLPEKSCEELLGELFLSEKRHGTLLQPKEILDHINNYFQVDSHCLELLKKHPKYRLVTTSQVVETLDFLKSLKFKDKVIAESISIVLYPRKLLEKTLDEIQSNAESLAKYGFVNGCVPKETNYFKYGTKEKQKLLQLCLYYLEKPCNFSGNGIWGLEAENESGSSVIIDD